MCKQAHTKASTPTHSRIKTLKPDFKLSITHCHCSISLKSCTQNILCQKPNTNAYYIPAPRNNPVWNMFSYSYMLYSTRITLQLRLTDYLWVWILQGDIPYTRIQACQWAMLLQQWPAGQTEDGSWAVTGLAKGISNINVNCAYW